VIDEREIVRVAVERLAPPEPAYERLVERRDRKRRNQRITAGVVGIAVFVAAVWIVTSIGSFDRMQTPAVPGGATGPAETGAENPEPPPLVEPVPIGTVTRSGAGCALEIDAEPIPSGAGRISVVNETNKRVSFELVLLRSGSTFAQFEAFVAEAKFLGGYLKPNPPGAYLLGVPRDVGPSAAGTITYNFTTGALAVVCLDYHPQPDIAPDYKPFAVVGPIVVP
jgi:hypothetical protein